MSDEEKTRADGTPTIGSLIFQAGQGAEGDGAISVDELQDLREVARILNRAGVLTVDELRARFEKK